MGRADGFDWIHHLQLIHDPRAHLHHPVLMPQQEIPLPFSAEFEVVIMIAVVTEEMVGS